MIEIIKTTFDESNNVRYHVLVKSETRTSLRRVPAPAMTCLPTTQVTELSSYLISKLNILFVYWTDVIISRTNSSPFPCPLFFLKGWGGKVNLTVKETHRTGHPLYVCLLLCLLKVTATHLQLRRIQVTVCAFAALRYKKKSLDTYTKYNYCLSNH